MDKQPNCFFCLWFGFLQHFTAVDLKKIYSLLRKFIQNKYDEEKGNEKRR